MKPYFSVNTNAGKIRIDHEPTILEAVSIFVFMYPAEWQYIG